LAIARRSAINITKAQLKKIPFTAEQLAADPLYDRVATAKRQNGTLVPGPDADQILPIASLTKLATALVLLERKPAWEKKITITNDDLAYPKQFVGPHDVTSEIAFAVGQTVTMADLWTAMLLASSNQAAALLAKHSGLQPGEFVAAMNARAQRLGLRKTRFSEPSGLDVSNVSTAREMAVLAAEAFEESLIADTSVLRHATVTAQTASGTIAFIPVTNRNYSLLDFGVDGAKTGFLIEAQRTVAVRKGDTIAVVLHARSMQERNRLLQQLLAQL
jgi:D-alanyl-D-alanine endopeptidase (penicillin-binding protein 7)